MRWVSSRGASGAHDPGWLGPAGVVGLPQAFAVGRDHGGRHAEPRIGHAERHEHLVADELAEVAAALALDDLGEQERHHAGLVAGARARGHARIDAGPADERDVRGVVLVVADRKQLLLDIEETAGVGPDVPDRDGILAAAGEFREVRRDRVVEVDKAFLPDAREQDRCGDLGARQPRHHRVGGHRSPGCAQAQDDLGPCGAIEGYEQLRTDVQPGLHASLEHRARFPHGVSQRISSHRHTVRSPR